MYCKPKIFNDINYSYNLLKLFLKLFPCRWKAQLLQKIHRNKFPWFRYFSKQQYQNTRTRCTISQFVVELMILLSAKCRYYGDDDHDDNNIILRMGAKRKDEMTDRYRYLCKRKGNKVFHISWLYDTSWRRYFWTSFSDRCFSFQFLLFIFFLSFVLVFYILSFNLIFLGEEKRTNL